MSLTSLLIHDITIHEAVAGAADRYGNPTYDTTTESVRGRIEPTEGNELLIDRDTRISTHRLFLAADTHITGTSEVEWAGARYRVISTPGLQYGAAALHHKEVELQLIEG